MLGLSKCDSRFLSDTEKNQLYTEVILLEQYLLVCPRMCILSLVNLRGERLNFIQSPKNISYSMLGECQIRTLWNWKYYLMKDCLYKNQIWQSIWRTTIHEQVLLTTLNRVKGHLLLRICTQKSIIIVFTSKIIRSVAKLSGMNFYILEELDIRISMMIINLCGKQKLGNVVTSSNLYALVSLNLLEKILRGRGQGLKQILVIGVRLQQFGGG